MGRERDGFSYCSHGKKDGNASCSLSSVSQLRPPMNIFLQSRCTIPMYEMKQTYHPRSDNPIK